MSNVSKPRRIRTVFPGEKHGRLTVLSVPEDGRYRTCECECGTVADLLASGISLGRTVSCGCYNRERSAKDLLHAKHGMFGTPEYTAWASMIARIENPKGSSYARYGGRGIKVDPKWRASFEAFYRDLGPRPSPQHSLGRIDNDGDYRADNVRWETHHQQNGNRSNTTRYEHKGESLTLTEWSHRTGIKLTTLHRRLKVYGWSLQETLERPLRGRKRNQ